MKNSIKVLFLLLLVLCAFTVSFAQTTRAEKKAAKAVEVKRLITSQNFVFVPQYAENVYPAKSVLRNYGFDVSKDKINVFMPTVRADPTLYQYNNNDKWVLTTSNFEYSVNTNKKGTWHILITSKKPNTNNFRYLFTIDPYGYGTLAYEGHIYFSGYIEELTPDPIASN